MNQPETNAENARQEGGASSSDAAAEAVAASIAEDAGTSLLNSAELQSKVHELQDRLIRTQAEMENFRRRTHREQEDARRFESLRLVRDMLPGLDGLNRAIASAEQTGDLQNLLNGIRMVAHQFRDILKAHHAEPIDALGRAFDPNLHEALTQVPSKDHDPMTVLQVVEMGYKLHDRVVRPARVIVSCAPPEA
ncbi:MAG: nucleotide exchange factor GrpE [Planctomycetota bacterium]